jgi:hypothetical protein
VTKLRSGQLKKKIADDLFSLDLPLRRTIYLFEVLSILSQPNFASTSIFSLTRSKELFYLFGVLSLKSSVKVIHLNLSHFCQVEYFFKLVICKMLSFDFPFVYSSIEYLFSIIRIIRRIVDKPLELPSTSNNIPDFKAVDNCKNCKKNSCVRQNH